MNTPHPQADILRAIADGREIQGRHFTNNNVGGWVDMTHSTALSALNTANPGWSLRIKPATIRIGSAEVNAPMREAPARGKTYWVPAIDSASLRVTYEWQGDSMDRRLLSRGLCFHTEEDARTAAGAILALLGGEGM